MSFKIFIQKSTISHHLLSPPWYKSQAFLSQISSFLTYKSPSFYSCSPCKQSDPSEAESRPCHSLFENSRQSPYKGPTKFSEICTLLQHNLLFVVHPILTKLRTHWVCPSALELTIPSTQNAFFPDINTANSLRFKFLPKYHSQEGSPSPPHFKFQHPPQKFWIPVTVFHFPKHLPLNSLYYLL